jgi:IclR family KDG regulon transcriptional repressor
MAYELQSLERSLEIVGYLSRAGSATLTQVADELGFNQTTCLRSMRVLERHGFVRRDDRTRTYALGMRLVELGALAVSQIDVIGSLRPFVSKLAQEFNVTAHVGLLRDGMVTVVDKINPLDGLVRYSLLGTRMPLHCTAMGKALLALYAPDQLSEVGLHPPLTAYTRATITDPVQLQRDVALSRERGYSLEVEEWQVGFACVGIAFTFADQDVAVSLSGLLVGDDELAGRAARLRSEVVAFTDVHGAAVQRRL